VRFLLLIIVLCCLLAGTTSAQYFGVSGLMMSKNGKVTYVLPQQDSASVTITLPNKSGVIALANEAGGAAGAVPISTIVLFAGRTIPTGFKECTGDTISRTVYANLFAAIDTSYGVGNGSNTFNLPKLNALNINNPSGMGKFRKRHNGMTQTREPPTFDSS